MFDDIIAASAARYNVPQSWIRAVIELESSGNSRAYRAEPAIKDASYGLMQLLTTTARGLGFQGSPEQLYEPATNIDLGSKLLGDLRTRYGDDFRRIYSAYNSGRPDLWQTSAEVAAHVARAMDVLEKYAAQAVETLTASPSGSSVGGAIMLLVLLYLWGKRGKGK